MLELLVQVLVVERRQSARESCAQFVDFGAREGRPAVGQLGPDLGSEAVAVEPSRAVPLREDRDLPSAFERHRGGIEKLVGHAQAALKRRSRGSGRPASAKPLARSRQESQAPQGAPVGAGS